MGLFGFGGSIPRYSPSAPYRDLTFNTVYPKLDEIIKGGGLGFDTAGMERTFKENTAANFGGAYERIRPFAAYGNPAAGTRTATRLAIAQAGEEGRGIRDIRTQSNQARNHSLLGVLGLASGLEDPALKQYYANLARYNAESSRDAGIAGLFGNLAGLGLMAANPGLGVAARMPGAVSNYAVNLPASPW